MGVGRAPGPAHDALILFDGHCVLCAGLFQWVLRRDRAEYFQFATAQSPLGQVIYAGLGLRHDDLDTMVVQVDGVAFVRLDAVAAVARHLPFPWGALSLLRHLPRWIKDPAYNLIAQNRYRLFGRSEQCLLPTPELQSRFAPDGFAKQPQKSKI
ncbi:DUF393 domain-containing protein [Epibacterium ulvae]|uniref:thiol-disulfide oxidoreductase DCC family protein n=1 Tax=Epibacterium ulvae TaxID=1156985 RepID=UPI001BFC3140|nr:DCC1-like thiol-disulfide oxidoreductase family protein [Epibacterium ulvae]MBT8154145.1 DUF393 domain-containing protein [Epibacterium ulvae]